MSGGLHSGGVHYGGLESRATDLGSRQALARLGVYILRGYTLRVSGLGHRFLNLVKHSPVWRYTLWGLHFEGRGSRATDFGSGQALARLGVYCAGLHFGGLESRATDCGSGQSLTCLGVYTLDGALGGSRVSDH